MRVWGQPQRRARVRVADVCPARRFLSLLGVWVLFAGQSPIISHGADGQSARGHGVLSAAPPKPSALPLSSNARTCK